MCALPVIIDIQLCHQHFHCWSIPHPVICLILRQQHWEGQGSRIPYDLGHAALAHDDGGQNAAQDRVTGSPGNTVAILSCDLGCGGCSVQLYTLCTAATCVDRKLYRQQLTSGVIIFVYLFPVQNRLNFVCPSCLCIYPVYIGAQ